MAQKLLRFLTHPLFLVSMVAVLITLFVTSSYMDTDLYWRTFEAQSLLDGATLYRDMITFHVWHYIYLFVPGAYFSNLLSVEPLLGLKIIVLVYSFIGIFLSHTVLRVALLDKPKSVRYYITSLIIVLLTISAAGKLGEKSHLVLAFTLPYLLLSTARLHSSQISPKTRLLVGVFAGIGFTIKPFYLLVPGMLFLYELIRAKKITMSVEFTSMMGTVAIIGVVTLILFPNYLWFLSIAVRAYTEYLNPLGAAELAVMSLLPLSCIVAAYRLRKQAEATQWTPLFTAACAF